MSGVRTVNKTLLHEREDGTSVLIPFYFTFPEEYAGGVPAGHRRQPLVFLMNGFAVEAPRYTGVISSLAARGFVVASSDYYHNWTSPPPPPFPREQLCLFNSACLLAHLLAPIGRIASKVLLVRWNNHNFERTATFTVQSPLFQDASACRI